MSGKVRLRINLTFRHYISHILSELYPSISDTLGVSPLEVAPPDTTIPVKIVFNF